MRLFRSKFFFDCSIILLKNKWLPFIFGFPLFFCMHCYEGVFGDARLYLLQVVNKQHPERFVNDPPFMFGNQDDYGVFSLFYDFVLKILPIDTGAFFVTLFGQFLWLAGAYYFVYEFSKRMQFRLWFTPLIICFIVYSGSYMPNDHIAFWRFVENIAVSRLYSLSVAIIGLGALLAQKKFFSLALFLLGTMIHPLTAGWSLPLWLFLYYPKTIFPVSVISAIFPLTFLLHRGVFDVYPVDWGSSTYCHTVNFLMFWREIVGLIFFGLFIPRYTSNKNLVKYSKAIFGVIFIGLYWLSTGGIAKHIFIDQVQVWRVGWLFFVLAMPFYAFLIYEQFRSFRHGRLDSITTHHVALFLFGFAMFMPAPCSGAVVLSLFLLFCPTKQWCLNYSMFILAFLCVLSALIQELTNDFLLGLVSLPLVDVTNIFREIRNLISLQFLWIVHIIILSLYIKKEKLSYCICFILLFYAVFPQFQLIPVLLTSFLLYSQKKISLKLLIPILLIVVGDCSFSTEYRETNILSGFPKRMLYVLILSLPILAEISLFYMKISNTKRNVILTFISIIFAVFAVFNYDKREISLKQSEPYLDDFRSDVIFPQIKDRGKMLYYVTGNHVHESRTQFLCGSYFSETTAIGEALFQKQFEEERKRINYLFFKEQRGYIARKGEWQQFVKDSLSQKNILLDRTEFLCSINEISHLVSSVHLTELEKIDSYMINPEQIVYLYECPNVK